MLQHLVGAEHRAERHVHCLAEKLYTLKMLSPHFMDEKPEAREHTADQLWDWGSRPCLDPKAKLLPLNPQTRRLFPFTTFSTNKGRFFPLTPHK